MCSVQEVRVFGSKSRRWFLLWFLDFSRVVKVIILYLQAIVAVVGLVLINNTFFCYLPVNSKRKLQYAPGMEILTGTSTVFFFLLYDKTVDIASPITPTALQITIAHAILIMQNKYLRYKVETNANNDLDIASMRSKRSYCCCKCHSN